MEGVLEGSYFSTPYVRRLCLARVPGNTERYRAPCCHPLCRYHCVRFDTTRAHLQFVIIIKWREISLLYLLVLI